MVSKVLFECLIYIIELCRSRNAPGSIVPAPSLLRRVASNSNEGSADVQAETTKKDYWNCRPHNNTNKSGAAILSVYVNIGLQEIILPCKWKVMLACVYKLYLATCDLTRNMTRSSLKI